MKVAVYSTTPIAGAPYQQVQCLKRYADSIDVRHIQQRHKYADGRQFPPDLYISQASGKDWIKRADVVHVHNYLPPEVESIIDFRRQKVVATLHSYPRQGNWKHLMARARKTFCIRQPMQVREYSELKSLPNLFDIWTWVPMENKNYEGKVNIVYCPSNKHPVNKPASKGYPVVHPLLIRLDARPDVGIIHHMGMEYMQNLRRKREGHIVIDDLIGKTWHLTSIEGACFGQVVLTSVPKDQGFPFVETNLANVEETINNFLDNRNLMRSVGTQAREWVKQNWNPKEQVKEYVKVYENL